MFRELEAALKTVDFGGDDTGATAAAFTIGFQVSNLPVFLFCTVCPIMPALSRFLGFQTINQYD